MRELTFTLYQKAQDTAGVPMTQPWEVWLDRFSRHERRGRPEHRSDKDALDLHKNGPALVLGEIPAGVPRRGSHVVAVHALALDIENRDDAQVEAVLKGPLAPYEWALWTTHKHGSEVVTGARLRVVLPLRDPIPPEQHAAAWEGLQRLTGGINDPSTKDVGRLHFLPSTFDPDVSFTLHHPGTWLDVTGFLTSSSGKLLQALGKQRSAGTLRMSLGKIPKTDPLKPVVQKLLAGEAFAVPGERHTKVLALTMALAVKSRDIHPSTLEDLFSPSLLEMSRAAPGAPTVGEVITAYEGALTLLQDEAKQKVQQEQLKGDEKGRGPYTLEELENIASINGWGVGELTKRWVIQKDGCAWFLGEHGNYVGPHLKDDFPLAASQYLARAPVQLMKVSQTGLTYKAMPDVIRESGTLATKVVASLTLHRSRFDAVTGVFYEALVPIRPGLKPLYNPEIDAWLKAFAGPCYDKVLDWMTCCSDLDKLLCALYFDGAPAGGKTLFAVGMARLWTDGPPSDIDGALSDFNDTLTTCPLVLADEEIPKRYGRANATAALRSLLSQKSRPLKRKYRSTADVRGAIRVVLAANNAFLLDHKDVSTEDDLLAIAQRFLYVKVADEAAVLLAKHPPEKIESWAQKDIAQHALWLSETRQVRRGARFWVEGDIAHMHRQMAMATHWNAMVVEWLVRYLLNPQPFDMLKSGLIRRGEGKLLVNNQALIDGWGLYLKTKQDPDTSKIGTALRAISVGEQKQLRAGPKKIRYREINFPQILSWSSEQSIGDHDTLCTAVGLPTEGSFLE